MRKMIVIFLVIVSALGLFACAQDKTEPQIVNTFEEILTYYEMSDGTWKTDDYTYKFRLEITGTMNNSEKDTTFVILSNTDDITFEQAWKASGLSSHTNDYFNEEDAIIVDICVE